MTTIKQSGAWQLNAYSQTKYGRYASGRGRIYVETRYHIQHRDPAMDGGVYNIKTKKEALKIWAEFLKKSA